MSKDFFIPIQLGVDTDFQDNRTDTLISPSGTVGAILSILKQTGVDINNILGFDQGIKKYEEIENILYSQLDELINKGQRPILMFSALLYNSEPIFRILKSLKSRYSDKIITVLGGQLVTKLYEFYEKIGENKSDLIDVIVGGDGELTIPEIVGDLKNNELKKNYNDSYYKQRIHGERPSGNFSTMDFERFFGMEELLEEQHETVGFGQITMQSSGSPGCASAMINSPCTFCALTNLTTKNSTKLEELLKSEFEMKKLYPRITRIYDVANQFLPGLSDEENIKWLENYRDIRNKLIEEEKQNNSEFIAPTKYCYLTIQSLQNKKIVELLKEIGVDEVYIGIDHLSEESLKKQHKGHRNISMIETALENLRNNKISCRAGIVLGSVAETKDTLKSCTDGLERLLQNYSEIIKFIGIFPVELLPGSQNFREFLKDLQDNKIEISSDEANEIINFLEKEGYLDREQQLKLNEVYIRNTCKEVSYEYILRTKDELEEILSKYDVVGYTVDKSPTAEVLKI